MTKATPIRDAALDAAEQIDGWTSRDELLTLYGLAFNAPGPIVEIGSWRGRSTAALALGSMAGGKQQVFAVDPFIGPQVAARATSLDHDPTGIPCSAEILRANLDAAGINGQVKIVAKPSYEALEDLPSEISLLFIDGSHAYEDVCRDIDTYLPRLKVGGFLVLHDVMWTDTDVIRAVEDKIRTRPNQLRIVGQIDSAMVVRKVDVEKRTVCLLCPGGSYGWETVTGIVESTLGAHRVILENNRNGWDDFNALWARAMNRFENGEITHVGMLHSDLNPQTGFLDILMDEMAENDLDLLSVACAMKDGRGVCNCGVGVTANRWGSWRRITVEELPRLPPTFGLEDVMRLWFPSGEHSLEDKVLLHNTGCFIADLRKPVFWKTDEQDNLVAWFDFPTKIRREGTRPGSKRKGQWINLRESEDWFFSRQLHSLGAKTRITRKVSLGHGGLSWFRNDNDYGTYKNGDQDTRHLWEKKA